MKIKTLTKKLLLLFVAAVMAAIIGQNNVYAATQVEHGLFTDASNVRWEYELTTPDEGEQTLRISFYDKPAALETVTVPSLAQLLDAVPNADRDLDTYLLKSASEYFQNQNFPSETRRESTKSVKKLDMSNTSKIQILGVKPILDPDTKAELVFGENMVIAEKNGYKIQANVCGRVAKNSWNSGYGCYEAAPQLFDIPNVEAMTDEQIENYQPTFEDIECPLFQYLTPQTFVEGHCYASSISRIKSVEGVFSGYKLKLTNFAPSNFNYIGWEAFANSEIEGNEVTIDGAAFAGGDIFKASSIEKVTLNTDAVGQGLFKDCTNLQEINIGDSVTVLPNDIFSGTNLTSFDFSGTNIKTIGARAFKGANLTSVDLTGIERIEYQAFAENDLRELYLPKSINYLQAELFKANKNLKKVTVAYDTLTSGTTLQFFVVLDNEWSANENYTSTAIEELTVIAPYAEDEEVSATHIPYEQYKWHYNDRTQEYMEQACGPRAWHEGCSSATSNDYGSVQYSAYSSNNPYSSEGPRGTGSQFEVDYADVDSKKNIIAPAYFMNLHGLKVITVGEGYEYIGSSAFTDSADAGSNEGSGYYLYDAEDTGNRLYLPDSLKGVGNLAFYHLFNDEYTEFTIPKNIEFIGIYAFKNVYYYDGDVDFPNLIALGDHAFEKTRTRNIYLHDKLQYMGAQVFSDCVFLNDITFDLDVFNPDIYIAWALPHRHGPDWYDGQFHFTTEFGPRTGYSIPENIATKYGIKLNHDKANDYWPLEFGTITFTDKNKSQLPNGYHNCYYFNERSSDAVSGCPGGYYGTGIYNTFFGHVGARKIDLGGTEWKVLSPRMFVQSAAGEVVLPHNLEVIPGDSFSDTFIQEELILPDTLKVIGDAAFDFGMTQWQATTWNSATQQYDLNEEWVNKHTIHITKLPESLEYLGNDAFYNDYGLTADLNSPNLRHIGWKAFWGTRVRDVYLPPTIKALHGSAFANIKTLRNITIDFDLGALPPNYDEGLNPDDFPESFREYAGANIYQLLHMSCSAKGMANNGYPVTTFYSLFNQGNVSDVTQGSLILAYGQKAAHTHFGKVVFTDKNKTDIYMTGTGYFSGLEFDELDMGDAGWKSIVTVPWGFEATKIGKLTLPRGLENFTLGIFENAEIEQPFVWPSTLKKFDTAAFQWAKGTVSNTLPEGLETIGNAAFYAADLTDDLVVPSTVTSIKWSAFNAGDRDVHYEKVTIKPNLNYDMDEHQMIHQMFWQNDIKEMVIESSELPVTNSTGGRGEEEFYAMPLEKVTFTNIPIITADAFLNNTKLKEVDMSQDVNLRVIADEAFYNDEKLHIIKFSPAIKNETVTVGQHAFYGTAFETMGNSSTDFDLTAAKFDASRGLAFAEMPRLRKVDVPNDFSKNKIPVGTFHNDSELQEASVDYRINKMETGAFSNDDQLERIFIWGNTVVEDEKLENYTAPIASAMNARLANVTLDTGEEIDTTDFGVTIPESTDIYAYSVSPTEQYAKADDRDDFESDFYPLDEVLYITSNKPRVLLNENEDDFDKSNLVVYGLRRDGVVLQSNSWGEFDGTVYPRSDSNLTFERMAGFQEENPVYGAVYDTPVPLNELDYGNVNFETIDFELIRDPDDASVRLVNIIYTDKYTEGKPDTDIDPNAVVDEPTIPEKIEEVIEKVKDIIPETPFTGDHIAGYVAGFLAFSAIATIFVIAKRRK